MKSALIIGAGQFGTHIAKRMEELRCEVMVVDINEECINDIIIKNMDGLPIILRLILCYDFFVNHSVMYFSLYYKY